MDQKRIARMSFIWNALYSGLTALQSSILLFAVARRGDFGEAELGEAGIITIGFTLAVLFMILARYGIRNYQVSDTREEYSFSDYFFVRVLTVSGSLLSALIYLLIMVLCGKYTLYKSLLISEIIILKLTDAFEGLYAGRLQQKGRLDIGARIATIRTVISTAVIFLSMWMIDSLLLCFLLGIAVSFLTDVIMIPRAASYADFSLHAAAKDRIGKLLLTALPLCVGTALHNYIGNAPKYLVDFFLTDELQAVSGYIMMPMFVITVLNSFFMSPTVKSLGDAWNSHDMTSLKKIVARHVAIISAAAFGVLILGLFVGLPFLSYLYRVDLMEYTDEFRLIMIGGTLYTLSAYAIVILTVMRRQKWVVTGCLASLAAYLALGKTLVSANGIAGAARLYIISNVILLAAFGIGIFRARKPDRV